MKTVFKVFFVILILIIALSGYILLSWDSDLEAPYPDLKATADSALIERGRYLVYGPAHCATCHVPMNKIMDVENGEQIPLSGGWELSIPPGVFRAPNLTPDEETGIGKITDGELARAMRYSVNHKNKYMMPFMPFQNLSDEDIVAILSFLRAQPPVKNKVEGSEFNFIGKALLSFGVVSPQGPIGTPPKAVSIEPSIEYGSYLSNSIANCVGCHTERDQMSGNLIGKPLAGGGLFGPDPFTNGFVYVSPNLTPDEETGIMANWDEKTFINRFRGGRVHEGSPMPWGAFSRLEENDLKALYLYLKSVDPVNNSIEKIAIPPGE